MARKKRSIEQYQHDKEERLNNPPAGLGRLETEPAAPPATYAYDPHLDPQLVWAGKAEHTSFEVPMVSLHVHERIDPRTIIEAVRANGGHTATGQVGEGAGQYVQASFFDRPSEAQPLREAVEFYRHKHGWSNRLVAGDSLLVMNSLLTKEGLGGQVQMIYIDPPYGIKYGSNFQPFVNKRDVRDGADADLTAEPEQIRAFRDTWELGIHSYLAYLRDRLLLARELLAESGSVFVQISDENVHHVREIMDEVFGAGNFMSLIAFATTSGFQTTALARAGDYVVWYAKHTADCRCHQLYSPAERAPGEGPYRYIRLPDHTTRSLAAKERSGVCPVPEGARLYRADNLISQGAGSEPQPFEHQGITYSPPPNSHWKANYPAGMESLARAERLHVSRNTLQYVRYADDFPWQALNNMWTDTLTGQFTDPKVYVVQTNVKVIQRCLLMTTDPGDLVLDPTCGSGTTATVAEQWGRRWITCDTSRVALALARQRLMTAVYDYYELAHPEEGVSSGFTYKTVPHITLKSIANNEPPGVETLYDQPLVDRKKTRVSGPFTVEAVPAPTVVSVDALMSQVGAGEGAGAQGAGTRPAPTAGDASVARGGETLRLAEWRAELLRTGVRGKGGQRLHLARLEPLPGCRWLHAEGAVVSEQGTVASGQGAGGGGHGPLATDHYPLTTVVSFGPEHAPLSSRQVAGALEEAQSLMPHPALVLFCAFQFDPEAAKEIDEIRWPGVTLLRACANADLLTDDLKKKRASNESFWLMGQPDVTVDSEEWIVNSRQEALAAYDTIAELSGADSLAEIHALGRDDLSLFIAIAQRRDLWAAVASDKGGGIDPGQHRRGAGAARDGGVSALSGHRTGIPGRIGDTADFVRQVGLLSARDRRECIERLRGNREIADRAGQIAASLTDPLSADHYPLSTNHYYQVTVQGFDYYNTRSGELELGGADQIAVWLLDTDYDGRSLFPRQVFFPMAGAKEGWARLARSLRAEVDPERIEAYRGTVSLPFRPGAQRRAAVKIVDDRGIESLQVVELE